MFLFNRQLVLPKQPDPKRKGLKYARKSREKVKRKDKKAWKSIKKIERKINPVTHVPWHLTSPKSRLHTLTSYVNPLSTADEVWNAFWYSIAWPSPLWQWHSWNLGPTKRCASCQLTLTVPKQHTLNIGNRRYPQGNQQMKGTAFSPLSFWSGRFRLWITTHSLLLTGISIKINSRTANRVNPDEMAHDEPSHLDLLWL